MFLIFFGLIICEAFKDYRIWLVNSKIANNLSVLQ
jgi:hypothetical protein